MRGPLWLLAGALAIGGLVAWLALRPSGSMRIVADLVQQLPSAKERRPSPDAFSVVDASLAGETKRAILIKETSRLVYSLTVPDDAMLRVSLGVLEEAWTVTGDGVLFRILLTPSGDPAQRTLVSRVVAPFSTPADRGWQEIELDLSVYAGTTIDLFFNTNASLPGADDRNGDLAVWGAPRIVAP